MADWGVEPLYEDEDSGQLNIGENGRAFRQHQVTAGPERPSLSGAVPHYGRPQSGIGGSNPRADEAGGAVGRQAPPVQRSLPTQQNQWGGTQSHQLSPEQMMEMANQMEQQFLDQQNDYSTAVDPALIRDDGVSDISMPDWLQKYSDVQPVDDLGHGGYIQEQELLRQALAQRQ